MADATRNKKTNWDQPWWRRKALYVLVAVVGVILTGLGVVTQEQVDALVASPLLATAIGLFAAGNTHADSDSTAPVPDVQVTPQIDIPVLAQSVAPQIATQVAELIDASFGTHAKRVRDQVANSVSEFYASPGADKGDPA